MSSENQKKSIVNADEFRLALSKVYRAASKSSAFCFAEAHADFHGNTCTLTCTDLTQWCQATIPAQGDEFSFVFHNTRKLLTACKYFSGDLELEYVEDGDSQKTDPDGILTLRCGNKSSTQRVTTAEDFPVQPEVKAEHTYTVNSGALYERYKRLKYAVSKDSSRPSRCCVEFLDNRMLAIDGHRLALSQDETLQVEEPFFIPTGALDLLPVFDSADCCLEVGKRHAAFDNGSIRIIARLEEDDGLDVEHIVPQKFREEHTVSVEDFINNLRYLHEFIKGVKGRVPVRYDGGVLSVKTYGGEYRANLNLATSSQIVCGLNAAYMLDALSQFKAKGAKMVTLRLDSYYAPVVLTDGDGDIALIVATRLKEES